MIRSLEQAGVDLQVFDPIQFGFFDTRMTYRNHRKIINIDGRVGFLGGMNIADEYANMKKNYPPFRDTMCQVKGSVLNSMAECFFKDYYYITNTLIKDDKYYSASDVDETGLVQVIPSGPDDKYPPIRNVYVKMINNAKQSIKIITPYLALDNELVTSLIIAAKSGVHVDIIVPGTPDKQLIYYVTESFYDELLSEGIHIHQYDQTFTHAKVLIIDDRLASCGTYNLDNRSARINFEVTLLLYKTGVSLLVEQYNNDLNHSTEINQASWAKKSLFKRIILGLMNLLAPLV
jgi:cardiolipin synthase